MYTTVVLILSLALQITAAGIAFKQINRKVHSWAWGCIAGALMIMAFRRGITFTRITFGNDVYTADPVAETLALIISILMFIAVLGLRSQLGTIQKEVQKAIDKGHDIYKSYLDMPFIGIATASPSQNWLEFNDRLCSIFGYSRDDLKIIPWPNLLHPHDKAHDQELFHEILENKRNNYSAELRFIKKDGGIAYTNFVVQTVRQHDASIEFLRVIVQDITAQRVAEMKSKKSNERFEDLVVNMNEGLVELDSRACITFANDSFYQKMGYEEPELLGKQLLELMSAESQPLFQEQFNKRKMGGKTPYEITWLTKTGDPFYTRIAPKPLFTDGEFRGSYAVITDLTQRKEIEQRLKEANQTLLEADQQKNQFLSSMNHELRTPLTSILGFTDILLRKPDELTEKQVKHIQSVKQSGHHLLTLINDMLDIAKIDAGMEDLIWEDIEIKEIVGSIVNLMAPQSGKKGHSLQIVLDEQLLSIMADARRLKQILFNLLSNAIKYTPDKGHISIKTRRENDQVIFYVTDTGLGIKKEKQEIIFDEFKQADRARDAKLGGIGIGLALTRRLVLLHGGQIGVESEEGLGSTFWFALPIRTQAELPQKADDASPASPTTPVTGKRILVVENNESIMVLIQEMLEMHRHIVALAKNGLDAVDLAQTTHPDLILMDIHLPKMDGMEATRTLRSQPDFAAIPIIAITAWAGEEARQACLKAGCTDFITKPIHFDTLTAVINKYLGPR